jgi:hypothetical protein
MAYNLGSVGTDYSFGYIGAYAGAGEPYVLTAHGTPHRHSVMYGNQFNSAGPVYFNITGADAAVATPDWPALSTNQLWLTNLSSVPAFNPVAAGSVTYTFTYRIQESGITGSFTRTIDVI